MKYCKDNYCINGSTIDYHDKLLEATDYEGYLDKIYEMLGESNLEKDAQSKILMHYTKMNVKRMERWNKFVSLNEEFLSYLTTIKAEIEFFVLTEAWCGDAAHVLPLIQKIVSSNSNFSMKTLMRDENLDIMDKYLTNGSRSIPVVIGLQKVDDNYMEIFKWGPKPMPMMNKMMAYKNGDLNISKSELLKETQIWYNADKSKTIQNELFEVMKKAMIL